MEKLLNNCIVEILSANEDLVSIAVKQRAKFEGWLKFELANKLKKSNKNTEVEYPYPNNSNQHADLFTNNAFIELKTSNTNYRVDGCRSCTRPITKNISSIIGDIEKLRTIGRDYEKYIAFVLFPIGNDDKHCEHIHRIKDEGNVELVCSKVFIKKVLVLVCSAKVL